MRLLPPLLLTLLGALEPLDLLPLDTLGVDPPDERVATRLEPLLLLEPDV